MKATEANLLTFLGKTQQFTIPIFQRSYSWRRAECEQLFNDVLRVGRDESTNGHFLGAVVYLQKDIYQVSDVPKLMVIDGQQRLTTVMLLLAAVIQTAEVNPSEDMNARKLRNRYLINADEEAEEYFKLMLTRHDREALLKVVNPDQDITEKTSRVVANYLIFLERLKSISVDEVYRGLQKLFIVDVALEQGSDDPQLIFESLNSTGLELTQADLIRNYVLMGQEAKLQTRLYNTIWLPMEQGFGREYDEEFDSFTRYYLTIKLGRLPKKREVYEEFKNYSRTHTKNGDIEPLLREFKAYADYYVRIALDGERDDELKQAFRDVVTLTMDVAYPVILELYRDYEQQVITKDEFVEMVRLLESYVFRRAICGIPTNSMNRTFASFMRSVDRADYLNSFKLNLYTMTSYRRFPDDDEFMRELAIKDVYNFRNRNYLLGKLENNSRKEKVNIESYTIEHIMPQNPNLSSAWRQELGEDWKRIQERHLHTLGNLTLTGYNSELSDRPFAEKRDRADGGFRDSPLRLNRGLRDLEHWTQETISQRADQLAQEATKVWRSINLPADILAAHTKQATHGRGEVYDLDHYEYLTDEIGAPFEQLRRRILNLDASVYEEFKKLYIAYKTTTNFVDVIPQKKRLLLTMNLDFDEIDDPHGVCEDVTNKGQWGNGNVRASIENNEQLDYIMFLIRQSFNKHTEIGGDDTST